MLAISLLFGWIYLNCCAVSSTVLPCTENRTELCVQNLATFITLDQPRFVNEDKLQRLCSEAENGQSCSSDFLRSSSCVSFDDQLRISLQIGRSQDVSKMLCTIEGYLSDPKFRASYLKCASCIEEHRKDISDCFASANIVEEPELEIVRNSTNTSQELYDNICCPMIQYIECSENAMKRSCGEESKSIVERILLKASGKYLEEFCRNIDHDFPASAAACVSTSVSHVALPVIYLILFCMIHLLYVFM